MADVTTTESPAASTRPADSFRPKPPRRGRKTLVRAIVLLIASGRSGRRLVLRLEVFQRVRIYR